MLSLHKLFLSAGAAESFDEVITPTAAQRKTLVEAKNAIRDHLRAEIRAATTTVLGMDRMVSPRFRTQGSWAYKTCVQAGSTPILRTLSLRPILGQRSVHVEAQALQP